MFSRQKKLFENVTCFGEIEKSSFYTFLTFHGINDYWLIRTVYLRKPIKQLHLFTFQQYNTLKNSFINKFNF